MAHIRLDIPGPPVPQARPRRGKGRFYKEPKVLAHEHAVWAAWEKAGRPKLTGPLSLSARFFINRKVTATPDLSNLVKLVEDALNGHAYHDDSQIVHYGDVSKQLDREHPRTELELTTWP